MRSENSGCAETYQFPLPCPAGGCHRGLVTIGVADAQGSNGDHDSDDDGLIEVSNLEQLDAIRYDSDGDGRPDDADHAPAYAAAFAGSVCGSGCQGYELVRSLDFEDGGSYASGTATAWRNSSELAWARGRRGWRITLLANHDEWRVW